MVCEGDGDWRAVLLQEQHQLGALHQAYEKERDTVYFQRVPATPPPLPTGKCIVAPLQFEPPQTKDVYFD